MERTQSQERSLALLGQKCPKSQCDIQTLTAKQNILTVSKPCCSCCKSATLRLRPGTLCALWDQGRSAQAYSQRAANHQCTKRNRDSSLEGPDLEHISKSQTSTVCVLQVSATKMLPKHESYTVSLLLKKMWFIRFDLGNSSNWRLSFWLWISFHSLRLLRCTAPSFTLTSLGSIRDYDQEAQIRRRMDPCL